MIIIFLGIFLIFGSSLIAYTDSARRAVQTRYSHERALQIAEAGISQAIWCLNNSSECDPGYAGETKSVGDGSFTTTLSTVGTDYIVTSTGTVGPYTKTLRATISQTVTSSEASFFYGVQVGAGGLVMQNNSFVDGNIYSNGSIDAGNGAYVTGDVYVAGGTALTADQQQLTQSTEFNFGDISSREDIAQSFKPSVTEVINYASFYLKKVGSPANILVYVTEDNGGEPSTTPLATGTLNASSVTSSFGWVDVSFNSNPELTANQTYWLVLDVNKDQSSKYYIIGKNTAAGYGNGVGLYDNDWNSGGWSSASGDFTFQTWMGGIVTYINGLTVGVTGHNCTDAHYATHHGDAHAHQVLNSTVECDAFYATDPGDISGSTVGRNKIPDSEDPAPEAMPISDGQITDWQAAASKGDSIAGDYNLTLRQSDSLGPARITGNMTVSNGSSLTLTGTIWVEGDILFENNATISLDPGYGSTSGIIVTDGQIIVRNNVIFNGSGADGSYILALTTNNSVSDSSPAIDINNNAETVIFYASNGMIKVANNAVLKEATGYKLELSNGASVSYESGLANANFANGPGGIWATEESTWQEL